MEGIGVLRQMILFVGIHSTSHISGKRQPGISTQLELMHPLFHFTTKVCMFRHLLFLINITMISFSLTAQVKFEVRKGVCVTTRPYRSHSYHRASSPEAGTSPLHVPWCPRVFESSKRPARWLSDWINMRFDTSTRRALAYSDRT